MWKLTARFDSGFASNLTGSETYAAPAGMVTLCWPSNVTTVSVPDSIRDVSALTASATWMEATCIGPAPNTFDSRTRTYGPPVERCTICRNVAFSKTESIETPDGGIRMG